jgi:hypothetical protein
MIRALSAAAAVALAVSGCGSGSGSPAAPSIGAARQYRLADVGPSGTIRPGSPVTLTFTVVQPSGAPLVHYRTGAGPHTGVHLIIVRDDLSTIIHRHPPVGAGGVIRQRVVFPRPGTYRMVVDVYPRTHGQRYVNFQLYRTVHVEGQARSRPLPPFRRQVRVSGWRFTMHGRPRLRVAQASLLTVTVADAAGRPARFTPWYGALAHAIFFHEHDLTYFHTHVCAPGAVGCTSLLGSTAVSGSSSKPGLMVIGVLLPQAGTWRMFLQCRIGGRIVTAPYTLTVR